MAVRINIRRRLAKPFHQLAIVCWGRRKIVIVFVVIIHDTSLPAEAIRGSSVE